MALLVPGRRLRFRASKSVTGSPNALPLPLKTLLLPFRIMRAALSHAAVPVLGCDMPTLYRCHLQAINLRGVPSQGPRGRPLDSERT